MQVKAFSKYSGIIILIGILSLGCCISGCMKKPQQAPAAQIQQGAPGEAPQIPQVSVQDTSNPRPEGETWVYSDKREYRIGQTMQIEYKVKRSESGKPWIGLIPISVEALDEGTNDASDVTFVYIEDPTDTGKVELTAVQKGDFYIRLFGSDSDDTAFVQGQTRPVVIRDWPQGSLEGGRLPVVTIEGQAKPAPDEKPEPMKFKVGDVVKGTYTLEEPYPNTAWLGLIPWSVYNRGADENDAADIAYTYLEQGALTGTYEFKLDQPGEYVMRLFPSTDGNPTATFQSVKLIVE